MIRKNYIFTLIALAALVMVSCKDNESEEEVKEIYTTSTTNALIASFNLQANKDVLANLDSVHFTIDTERGLIYNVDSLPVGTDISHMLTTVTFNSTVGVARYFLTYEKNGVVTRDTIAYSSSSTDSINFTGSACLEVNSYDGTFSKRYDIHVNVHQIEPDTLVWPLTARRDLPGAADDNVASKTVEFNGEVVSLIQTADGYRLSTAETPAGPWTTDDFAGAFTPDVNSMAASDDALYVLDMDGNLYTSADALSWTSTGTCWHSIIGGYQERILGLLGEGTMMLDEYPRREGFTPTAMPDDFPVDRRSQLVTVLNDWAVSPQAVMVGGILYDGQYSDKTWGYDGQTWAVISSASDTLPALSDAILLPYYTFDVSAYSQKSTKQVTWLLMGGFLEDGTPNRVTYMSRNQGITWAKAASSMQWPGHIPSMGGAQAIVDYVTMTTSNSASQRAPRHISEPVTEWECPYIYLFGGYTSSHALLNNVWRGVITRLTFNPQY